MQILLRIAVEEKFLKNRHVRGRDLVDDDNEIGSGDLLVLLYECLPFVPTRMLSLKQRGCAMPSDPSHHRSETLGLTPTKLRTHTAGVHRGSYLLVPPGLFLTTSGNGLGLLEGLELFQFFLGHGASVLPRTTMVPITPIRDAGRSMPRFLPDAGQISVRWSFRRPPVQASNASATAQAVVRKASESGLAGPDGGPIQRSPGVNPGVGVPSSCVSSFVECEVS